MADTKFRFYVTQYDGNVFFEDQTEYGCTINNVSYEREEVAIAVIYSTDDRQTFKALLGNDYTMEIGSVLTEVIDLTSQIIKIYENRAYSINEITYKDGYFYSSLINDNHYVPSQDNAYWVVLTESNASDLLLQNASLGYYLKKVDTYHRVPENVLFDVNKLSSTDYEFINSNSSNYTVSKLELYDWEDKLIDEVNSQFQINKDGAYKLRILYTQDSNKTSDPGNEVALLETSIPILRIDDIECCYKKLIKTLYCTGSTFCVDGNCFAEREKINNINEIQNIYFALISSMNVLRLEFYNVMGSNIDVEYFVQDVGRLIKTIRLMVEKCKNCCDE